MDQSSGEVLSALMLFNVVVKKGWDYEGNCTGKMYLEVEKKKKKRRLSYGSVHFWTSETNSPTR